MFIWVGERRGRRRRGHCLRLCPICHAVRVFTVREVRKYTHIYLVPLGKGDVVATYLQCQDCGVRLAVHPTNLPPHHPSSEIHSLWELCTPAERAALEKTVADRLRLLGDPVGADPDARADALVEPFLACEMELASRCGRGEIHDVPIFSRYGMLVAFGWALFFTGVVALDVADNGVAGRLLYWIPFIGAPALIGVVLYRRASVPRFVSQRIFPLMFRALAPLRPNEAELAAIEDSLKQHGYHVTQFGLARRLSASMEHAERESFR